MTEQSKRLIVHNPDMQKYDEIIIMDEEEKIEYQRYVRVK